MWYYICSCFFSIFVHLIWVALTLYHQMVRWLITSKGFGRTPLWPDRGIITVVAWRVWGKLQKTSEYPIFRPESEPCLSRTWTTNDKIRYYRILWRKSRFQVYVSSIRTSKIWWIWGIFCRIFLILQMIFNLRVATVPLEVVKKTPSTKPDDIATIFIYGFQHLYHVALLKESKISRLIY
jgi:hypothetical protein